MRAAASAGFSHVEFWSTANKNLEQRSEALRQTGAAVTCFMAEPTAHIVDRATHDEFLRGIERSAALAKQLNAVGLIVVTGDGLAGVEPSVQREAVTEVLVAAAPIARAAGICLLLEPLNTDDHPCYFLDSTVEGLAIVRDVNDPSVRLLYDIYHSVVMGEDPQRVLAGSRDLVGHVHIADVPGRHEPATGGIHWPRALGALRAEGYAGTIGLEYRPARDTESSLEFIRRLIV